MRLTLIISSLSAGGAERVVTLMANYWADKGRSITLLTFDDGTLPPFYALDARVHHRALAIASDSTHTLAALWSNLRRVRRLRSAIRASRPDGVISFLDRVNILTLLATRGLKIPVVVMEQAHPGSYPIGRAWERLRNWTYPRAERVVAVTARALDYFSPRIKARACVIPNPAVSDGEANEPPSDQFLTRPSVIAVGRLIQLKGHDLLLQAFSQLKDRHSTWTLTILGEGPSRAQLESLRHQLGIADRVHLPGSVQSPYSFLRQADLFVMTSRFEGFPLALCEAMACGLAVISTDCPSGPREIIRDGVDGILVPNEDVEALAEAMGRLMSDEEERRRLGLRAREVTERFGLKKVMAMWEELLGQLVRESVEQ